MISFIVKLVAFLIGLYVLLILYNAMGPLALLVNTLIALVVFKILSWLGIKIEVSLWSLLIVLIFGIIGLLVVMFLSLTGIAFKQRKG